MAARKKKVVAPASKGRSVKHGWLSNPLLLAVTPVIIGAILTAFFVFVQNRPAESLPKVEVDSTAVQPAQYYPQSFKITFEIRNTGNQLAIIRGARLRILQYADLPICVSQGDLPETGSYSANMPVPASVGTIIDIPVSQQVGPDAADEFQLLLRAPKKESFDVNVYRFDVSLLYDNVSTPIDAGDVIAGLPFDPDEQYVWTRAYQATHGKKMEFMGEGLPEISQCMINNAKRLNALLSLSGQRSSTLSELGSKMAYCCTLSLPVVGVVGCIGQKPSVRPSSIPLGCDGGTGLQEINWSEWSFSHATGSATFYERNCQPSCADSTFHTYPVKIRYSKPVFIDVSGYSDWVWDNSVITFTGRFPVDEGRNIVFNNLAPNS